MAGPGLHVAFRADASSTIGNGHVMRCLTLAAEVARRGGRASFVCRAHRGHLGARIAAAGHSLYLLDEAAPVSGPLAHARWLGGEWQADAEATRRALAEDRADWLVVDHYALDQDWEDAVRPVCGKVMVIDDLADRRHACDLLLDQNLGREAADYDGLVPGSATRLIGPRNALLRPEFAAARPGALAARKQRHGRLGAIVIAMGGTDPANTTGVVLDLLEKAGALGGLQVTVVLGSNAPHLAALRARIAPMAPAVRLLTDVADMAGLLTEADLAIGAAGGTSWERCCLGLPALVLVLADNQRPGAEALAATGAALLCGDIREAGWQDRLLAGLERCREPDVLAGMTRAAQDLCDGAGAARVVAALSGRACHLRVATIADAEAVWHWRRAMPVEHLESAESPPLADHLRWFGAALADADRLLLMVCLGDEVAGHMRLDRRSSGSAAVSIVLNPAFRGQGLATPALRALCEEALKYGLHRLDARIHEGNIASQRAFQGAGFVFAGRAMPFTDWIFDLVPRAAAGKETS